MPPECFQEGTRFRTGRPAERCRRSRAQLMRSLQSVRTASSKVSQKSWQLYPNYHHLVATRTNWVTHANSVIIMHKSCGWRNEHLKLPPNNNPNKRPTSGSVWAVFPLSMGQNKVLVAIKMTRFCDEVLILIGWSESKTGYKLSGCAV